MSLSLDPILEAAQESSDRHPLCRIISSKFIASIPFSGNYFNTSTTTEQYPYLVEYSDGRLASVFSTPTSLVYRYSDADKIEFTDVTIVTSYAMYEGCIVNMGDRLGVLYSERYSSSVRLRCMTISETGTILSGPTTIESYSYSSYQVREVNVIKLANGTYLAVYRKSDLGAEEHYLMKRTSSDFITWSSESALSWTAIDPEYRKSNPSLVQVTSGDVLLFFDQVTNYKEDGSEIVNLFYTVSSDNGGTWGAPTALSNITAYGRKYRSPSAVMDSTGKITLAYHLESSALHMNDDTANYCTSGVWCTNNSYGTDIHFDSANNKLYWYVIYVGTGDKAICSVLVVDLTTWEIEECYSSETTPGFSTYFNTVHVWWHRNKGDGYYACFGANKHVCVINHDAKTVTHYNFATNEAYGLTKNVEVDWRGSQNEYYCKVQGTWVDFDSRRLYVYFINTVGYPTCPQFLGYIDLTQTQDPLTGLYTWNEVFYNRDLSQVHGLTFESITPVKEANMVMVATPNSVSNWTGALYLYSLSSGALIKKYSVDTNSSFHWRGASYPCYYDGHIYAGFPYYDLYDQQDRRGLMDINLANDAVTYITPTYATGIDNYYIYLKKATGDGRLVIATGYGVMIYDINSGVWTVYNNTTVPGLTPSGSNDFFGGIEYDPATGNIFVGAAGYGALFNGIVMFNETGDFKQGKYRIGEFDSSWQFTEESNLTRGINDSDMSVIKADADDELWSFWTRKDSSELSLKWDREEAARELMDYLVDTVEVSWDVEDMNTLVFSLSHGHLFDPFNLSSTLSPTVAKGRKITLDFGDRVSSANYYQSQGSFVVHGVKTIYQRGTHPIARVECNDITNMWRQATITATEYYDNAQPENVLADLVETHGSLSSEQIDLPAQGTMYGSHLIEHQWIDTTLFDAIKQLTDHFGYIPYVDVNGKFSIRRVNLQASISHTYTSRDKIINFSPDDVYSNLVNRVVVRGEGNYFIEVSYAEESLVTDHGTMGWWGCKETKRYYYDSEQQKRCRNIRLSIIEPPTINIFFTKKGGGTIQISNEDTEGYWVEIYIKGPNLIWVVVAALAAIVAIGYFALPCDGFVQSYCGPLILALSLAINVFGYLISAQANYQFEIFGCGVGFEKQTFQAQADDLDLQRELNAIIKTEIDDTFCYTAAYCKQVADRELEIVKAQRRRLSFEKIAHLQDEITDVITVVHPYTQQPLTLLITHITRRYTKPDKSGGEGGIFDQIEGWQVL